jgi:hypothetical protein
MNTARTNRSMILVPLLGLSCLALAAGCTVEERVVRGPRPHDRVETITIRPSERHTWSAGRWENRGNERWEWIGGRWEIR